MYRSSVLRRDIDSSLPVIFDSTHELDLSLEDFRDHHDIPIITNMADLDEPEFDDAPEPQAPTHPIPSMQSAFAESMLEASNPESKADVNIGNGNSAARRKLLLEQGLDEETHASRWKQKPGQKYHQLWKLMAQISFGIYLLLNGIAKDDDQVVTILQGHVDEVDAFLEATLEDFDLAQEDIDGRLKNLKLPLENIHIFDGMLEDRQFRLQIVTGNERIEHIITRTAAAMKDALKDVQQGMEATKEFAQYMEEEQQRLEWQEERPEMQRVFEAMKGNADGWYKAYVSLQTKGNHLGVALVQLGSIVAEMDRRAGEVSRKTRVRVHFSKCIYYTNIEQFSFTPSPASSSAHSPQASPHVSPHVSPPLSPRQASAHYSIHNSVRSRQSVRSHISVRSFTKELPTDPNMITPAIRATLPTFQMVSERERTPEPSSPSSPESEIEIKCPEPEFTLQPRTYSPAPRSPMPKSPREPIRLPTPEPNPPPEIRERSSLRNRFSLKRKPAPSPILSPPPSNPHHSTYSNISQSHSLSATQNPFDDPQRGSVGLGLDSAYCSSDDRERAGSMIGTPNEEYHAFISNTSRSETQTPNPNLAPSFRHDFGSTYVSSPRSDQLHFHPVRASPHSPLQRPWTAAPSNHNPAMRNSSGQSVSGMSRMTMMTNATTATEMSATTEGGKKIKKKKSGFGWLKKAFALDEEEKRAFEERRRAPPPPEAVRGWERGAERKWVDGKRVDGRRVQQR
jgi:hypothetical protein